MYKFRAARRVVEASLVVSAIGTVLTALPAGATAAYVVNSSADQHDLTPNGICATAAGVCTLRAALDEANASAPGSGPIYISVTPASVQLSLTPIGEDANAGGDLDITTQNPVNIRGTGTSFSTLTALSGDRVLDVIGAQVTLTNVYLTGGTAVGGGGLEVKSKGSVTGARLFVGNNVAGVGGGISLDNSSITLTEGSTVFSNSNYNPPGQSGGFGGGIVALNSSVRMSNSNIQGNVAGAGFAGGGGIFALGSALDIRSSLILNNQVSVASSSWGNFGGGGIALGFTSNLVAASTGSSLTMVSSSVESNDGGRGPGGGILAITNSGFPMTKAVISRSVFEWNRGAGGGALAINRSYASVSQSSMSANMSLLYPAGFGANVGGSGGAVLNTEGRLELGTSTLEYNSSALGGGAISTLTPNGLASTAVASSTIAENTASAAGGGLEMAGKGQLDVGSSTITRNVASTTAANLVSDIGSVTVANSIVGEPRSVSGLTIASCYSAAGIQSGGYNLMTDATCKLTALSDRIAPTTGVGPLANNTGPLAGTGSYAKVPDTMLPVAGGPAVDQIPSLTLSPDERGVSRPVGPKADIGSVERRLVAPY